MRRHARILSITVSLVAVSVVAAIVWRAPLAEAIVGQVLRDAGFADPSVDVTGFGLRTMTLENLDSGAPDGPEVSRISISYSWDNLLEGRATVIDIEGLRLAVAFRNGEIAIPGFRTRAAGETASETGIPAIPAESVRLDDGRVTADTPQGRVTLRLTGAVTRSTGHAFTGDFDYALSHPHGSAYGTLSLRGDEEADLRADLSVADAGVGFGGVDLAGVAGKGVAEIRRGILARAALDVVARKAEMPGPDSPIAGQARATLAWEPPEAHFDIALTEGSGDIAYRAAVEATEIGATASGFDGKADIAIDLDRLEAGALEVRRLRFEAPLHFAYSDNSGAMATLAAAGSLDIREGAIADVVTLTAPVSVTVEASDVPFLSLMRARETGPLEIRYAGALSVATLRAEILRGTGPGLPIAARDIVARLKGKAGGVTPGSLDGRVNLGEASLADPALALREGTIEFRLEGEPTALTATANAGEIAELSSPALFAPVAIDARISGPLAALRFDAAVRGERKPEDPLATVKGVWPPNDNEAVIATFGPFGFEPGGLQPADISPRAGVVERASGTVSASLHLEPAEQGFATSGSVDIEDLSFTAAGTRIEGLVANTHFSDLDPPATPPGQVVSIRRIDLPAPLLDFRGVYEVEHDSVGRVMLNIASARAEALGGTLAMNDTTLRFDDPQPMLPLELQGLDLERLFALADLDGFSGSGSLNGTLPVTISGTSAAIRGGRLVSTGGVLHVRSDQAASLLAQQGESVDMALRALEDFRYSELSIDLDKPLDGNAKLSLSMLGHNPAVLDGHPFRFNINLSSNVDELVAALLQGYRIATDAFARETRRP